MRPNLDCYYLIIYSVKGKTIILLSMGVGFAAVAVVLDDDDAPDVLGVARQEGEA